MLAYLASFLPFLFGMLLAIALTVGATLLVIRFIPPGWRTIVSVWWTGASGVLLNMLEVVQDIDWSVFLEKRGLATGLSIGISWSIILLKNATVQKVKQDTIQEIAAEQPVKVDGPVQVEGPAVVMSAGEKQP